MYPRVISASSLVLCAVFLVFRAFSAPAVAQVNLERPADLTSSVVPPEVRAEVRQHLEAALAHQVASNLPAVIRTDKQVRNDAAFCNTGKPYRGYGPGDGSRADACGRSGDSYKACDLDITGKWCDSILLFAAPTDGEAGIFVQGHPERPEWLKSLAFVEEAANCRGNCMARAISYFGGAAGVPFAMADWPLTKWSNPTTGESRSQLILGRSDEIWFYTRMCLEQGIRAACPHLSELGVRANEEAVAAANRRQAEIDQEAILERDL